MAWARAVASLLGGKCRLAGYLAADDPQGADEGKPVGVYFGLAGGLAYQVADVVVGEQEGPDFLFHHLG